MSALRSRRQPRLLTSDRQAGGDYDESRRRVDELLGILGSPNRVSVELEEGDAPDVGQAPDLAELDTDGEDIALQVVAKRADEFMCSRCFLIQHRSRLASSVGEQVCTDCL